MLFQLRTHAASALIALALVTLPVNAAVDRLDVSRVNANMHGWNWGLNDSQSMVSYTLPATDGDLIVQVQGYNIERGQVRLKINDTSLGMLDRTPTKGSYTAHTLWVVPKSMLGAGENMLRFENTQPNQSWGIRQVTVFDMKGRKRVFGNPRGKRSRMGHERSIRVRIPARAKANALITQFFDVPNGSDVAVVVNGKVAAYSNTTADDKFGKVQRIALDRTTRNVVDFVHLENRFGDNSTDASWGVNLVRLAVAGADDGSTGTGSSSSGGSSSGSSTSSGGTTGSSSGSSTSSTGGTTTGSTSGGTTGSSSGTTTGGSSGTTTGSSSGSTTGSSSGSTSSGGGTGGSDGVESLNGMRAVTNSEWDETAVRQVLHVFAFGGQASASQISLWARMDPQVAITEMLNMDEHNMLLSPADASDLTPQVTHNLSSLGAWLASANSPMPADKRSLFGDGGWQQTRVWAMGTLLRGFNPFRQRIGLWETNYHMAVNKDAGVDGKQLIKYYDDIMDSYVADLSYEKVMGDAAKSAAVARQYKHDSNRFRNGECECNEDFAREFYQLFFGILGVDDHDYHETVTIKNMAYALTDMDVVWRPDAQELDDYVTFGTDYHFPDSLELLRGNVGGSRADQRINTMSNRAINHAESLATIPVMVVEQLADNNLSEAKKNALRTAWASMGNNKDMVRFIQNYAISTLFHNPGRVKYWNSIERNMLIGTRMTLNNAEAYLDLYSPTGGFQDEDVDIFSPRHNVFGGQTGTEAAASPDIFMRNYNMFTDSFWRTYSPEGSRWGQNWAKNWASVIPPTSGTTYRVSDVAEFLWNYFHADGLKNFGPLERAQVYSLLEGEKHIQYRLYPGDNMRVLTTQQVQNNSVISSTVTNLGNATLPLRSSDRETRLDANGRVGAAINFIAATPYMFAQESQ